MNKSYVNGMFVVLLCTALLIVIRFSTMQGQPVIDLKAALTKDNVIDILIIGSGPAGLLAAVYGGRAHHNTWVLEGNEPGGLLTKTSLVENWPGEISIMGQDIINHLKAQAERQGANFLADTAVRVDFSVYPYVIYTEEDRILHALSVIIATGATPKKLGIPGEEQFWGLGGVSNCAICDAPQFQGLDVVVVGGGDAAVEEALQLAPYVASVTIMVRSNAMRAAPSMQARLKGYSNITVRYNVILTEIEGNQTGITSITVKDLVTDISTKEPMSGVFLAIGHVPNTWVFKDQIKLTPSGHIVLIDNIHRTQQTSVPGVFVAGDVADMLYRQASIAAGDGARAAIDADGFLRERGYNESLAAQLEDRRFIMYTESQTNPIIPLESIQEFNTYVRNYNGWVAVDFYAEYCPSCLNMLPVLEYVAKQYADRVKFFKVDIEKSPELATYLKVKNVPTFILYNNGNIVVQNNKPLTKSELRVLLDEAGIKTP
ncbi:MAG TPA: FAD-dependent oxidoreductase [Candidatus Babeliales bacterium]|jgi:thioredoxin reductase (NADPH)|nr:FAD-dependent oxidoreductase [Candidatus Babeliales bacterium]